MIFFLIDTVGTYLYFRIGPITTYLPRYLFYENWFSSFQKLKQNLFYYYICVGIPTKYLSLLNTINEPISTTHIIFY